MTGNPALSTTQFTDFRGALIAAVPHVIWRETYNGTNIGAGFMN